MKNWFQTIAARLAQAFGKGIDYTAAALPIISKVATIGTALTPTQIDDLALAAIKAKYPRLFDGTPMTGDELKLYLLGAATEVMQRKYPQLTTTLARLAVQHAYAQQQEVPAQ